ncbi:MAG: TM2 domain-containing protein [Muribaculaceae bacterium]|nr:TM2 domain-containing protein [Muribaculaceae bacterium]
MTAEKVNFASNNKINEKMKQCPKCQYYVDNNSNFCPQCGYSFVESSTEPTPPPINTYNTDNAFDVCGPEGKSRGVAALLAILLGSFGVHYFYLNKVGAGILTLILSAITCGVFGIIILIQGIMMLCMTNEQFRAKHVTTNSSFPLF